MKIVVLKFGGTSVGSIEKIRNVSNIIQSYKKKGDKVIVVSSAMSGVTNDLIKKSRMISKSFSDAEYDVLVASGEQIACSLIAGRLIDQLTYRLLMNMRFVLQRRPKHHIQRRKNFCLSFLIFLLNHL